MEPISLRKWLKTNIYHSKSLPPSSDCVFSAAPSSSLGSEIPEAALATPACGPQVEHLQTSTLDDSKASPRVSLIAKKGKRKSAERQSVPIERIGLHLIHQIPQAEIDEISPEKQCPIDIVAVHGIRGGAYRTWAHSNGHFWLRDSLPEEVPGARIFSYGYPANVFLSHEKGRIDDHATSLLEELRDVRQNHEEQKRPIVFICHSMGGIVVKKALNITVVNNKRFSNIRTSTAAIFFLATPHCGSDPAKILSVCADILNLSLTGLSRFTGKMRSDMVKALAHGSTTLLDISNDFKEHPGNMRIFSFIEQKSTPPISGKIVDDTSGRMFVAGEVSVPMQGCNHREVACFESKDSNGYRKIVNKLKEVTSEITNKLTAELLAEDLPCLASLTFPSLSHRLSSLSAALSETCAWILSHPSFLTWSQANSAASSAQTRILYIKGHPGTGKSTLLSFLYHFHLQQPIQYKRILLSFFFHENGDWLQKCPTGMFRSLLVQLYKQSLSARRTILTAYNEKKEDNVERTVVWTVDEMQSLFLRIVSSEEMRESEVVILIDALDEAVDEEGAKAATSLREYFQKLTDPVRGRAKIVISCREYPVVVVGGDGLHISIQDENRRDIERFVSYHFQIGVEDWEIQDERVRMNLEKAIVDTADGIFLWVVKRMERIVEELNDGSSSFADVQRLVETESNELFKMYEGILQREVKESAREKAALFLQWVCLAERPLSLTEIRIAMACNERFIKEGQERIEESNDFVESDARMQRLTRSLSGGLAEVKHCAEGSTVQLIHQTVNEFLREGGLKSLLSDMGGPKSSCLSDSEALGRCENTLSRTCFGYLRLGEIAKFSMTYGIAPVPKAHEVEEKFPFIRYAVMFCFLHARRAESLGISQSDLPVLVDQPIGTVTFKISHGDEIPISDRQPSIFETWKVMFEASRRLYEDHLVPWMHLIHKAADCNLLSAVRYLVEERGQIEVRDRFGGTPLHHAVQGGHEYLVRWLLDSGADLESEDCRLGTPLELAVVKRHDHIIKLLLERGAETNKPSHQFSNTLEAACNANGPMELVEHLIDSGAEVNRKEGTVGRSERTALEAAAHAGNEEVVRLLIAKGAKVNAVSEHHGSALQAAVQGRRSNVKAIVELLLQKGADINARGGTYCNALQSAANFSSPDVIELLLDIGADVNAQGGYYGNALQAACDNVPWNEEVVQLLLSRGADVNAPLGHYGSPLQAAAASGSATVFRMLWDKGARADIKGGCHQNMIEAAGFGGNREIVQHLLDSGADINERGGNLYGSALQAAVLCGSESFVEFLLDKGADVNLQGGSFGNALCAAVETRGKMIEILLKRGADVHAAAPGNLSALQSAVKIGNAKHMKALREHGNEINA